MNPTNSFALLFRRAVRCALLANLTILAGLALPFSASALTINAHYSDPSITGDSGTFFSADPNAGLIEATINGVIANFEHIYSTPITVNIAYGETTSGLGESNTFIHEFPYADVRTALIGHATSAADFSSVATLPMTTNDPVLNKPDVVLTTADARALGFSAPITIDGTILLNTNITNYPGKTFSGSNYDLTAVVAHEMDEVLGTGSALNGTLNGDIRAQDLFRYSAPGTRSLTTAGTAYFSVNGGTTNLVNFYQPQTLGAGDYGDWAGSATPHVQDAIGTRGVSVPYGSLEMTALDVLGYTIAVPEPSTFVLAALGSVALLCQVRRRR